MMAPQGKTTSNTERTIIMTNHLTHEEIEAAKLEGSFVADEDTYELYERYKELKEQMKPLEAEMNSIKELLKDQMIEHHARHLTHDGVDITTLTTATTSSVDKKKLAADLGEDVAAGYFITKETTRMTIK